MKARISNSSNYHYGCSISVSDLLIAVKFGKSHKTRCIEVFLKNVPRVISHHGITAGYWKIACRYQWSYDGGVPSSGAATKLWTAALASKLPPMAWDLAMTIGGLLAKIKQIQDILDNLE